jgi:hypothetical protein
MKGVIFVEFLDVVEELYSYEMVDQILLDCDLASGGSYTSVGTYSHEEMLNLVNALSVRTNIESSDLIFTFGKHLFGRLAARYPEFIESIEDSFSLVKIIENHIHKEVRKLYPEAELPVIRANQLNETQLVVTYRSARPFADLALGLLTSSTEFFGENIQISQTDLEGPPGTHAQFTLTRL